MFKFAFYVTQIYEIDLIWFSRMKTSMLYIDRVNENNYKRDHVPRKSWNGRNSTINVTFLCNKYERYNSHTHNFIVLLIDILFKKYEFQL